MGISEVISLRCSTEKLDDLGNRIISGCNSIKNDPGEFKRVFQSMTSRLKYHSQAGGSHLEPLL